MLNFGKEYIEKIFLLTPRWHYINFISYISMCTFEAG